MSSSFVLTWWFHSVRQTSTAILIIALLVIIFALAWYTIPAGAQSRLNNQPYYQIHVKETPAACIYVLVNHVGSGVGIVAVPRINSAFVKVGGCQ